MTTVTYKTGNGAAEGRICCMPPAAAVELNAGSGAAPGEAAWYDSPVGDDDYAKNTTAWD